MINQLKVVREQYLNPMCTQDDFNESVNLLNNYLLIEDKDRDYPRYVHVDHEEQRLNNDRLLAIVLASGRDVSNLDLSVNENVLAQNDSGDLLQNLITRVFGSDNVALAGAFMDVDGSADVVVMNGDGDLAGYEPVSKLMHVGIDNNGHYTAAVKHQDTWYNCNDLASRVSRLDAEPTDRVTHIIYKKKFD